MAETSGIYINKGGTKASGTPSELAKVYGGAPGDWALIPDPSSQSSSQSSNSSPATDTTKAPVPTPTPQKTPLYPISSAQPGAAEPGTDPNTDTAKENLKPKSADEIFAYYAGKSGKSLDAVRDAANAAELSAYNQMDRDVSGANADAARRGMVGATGDIEHSKAITDQQEAVAKAEATKSAGIAAIMKDVLDRTQSDMKDQEVLSADYISKKQDQAKTYVSNLAKGGHSLDEAKQTDPNAFDALLQSYGGDRNAMQADWIAAAAPMSIDGGKPIQAGSNLIYTFKDPTTGKVYTQTVDTGIPLDANWAAAKDGDGNIIVYNKETGQTRGLSSGVSSTGYDTAKPTATSDQASATGTSTAVGGDDVVTKDILTATGLSIQAFNFLTQGPSSMSRLSAGDRKRIMAEAGNWSTKNGVDLATFASQYKAYNESLSQNIQRFSNTQVAEDEVLGTLKNLKETTDTEDFSNIKADNVATLFAKGQVNDKTTTKYASFLNNLKTNLAYFYAAQEGKSAPEQTETDEAEKVIVNGMANGSLDGLQEAIQSESDKMVGVAKSAVDRAHKSVWDIMGVGDKYGQTPATSTNKNNQDFSSGDIINVEGSQYIVNDDGSLSPA